MAITQKDADFFRPLWRRIAVTGVLAGWCAYEVFFSHDQMWIAITAAGLVYCVWNLFLRYPKDQPAAATGDAGAGTPPPAPSGPSGSADGPPKA